MSHRQTSIVATILTATILGGGVSLLSSGSAPTQAADAPAVAVGTPAERQQASFAVLRSAPDAGTASAKAAATLASLEQQGARVSDAHAINTAYGTAWVVPAPARDSLCLVMPDPVEGYGVTCQRTAEAVARGLVGSMVSPDGKTPTVVAGVLPDSVRNLVLIGAGSKRSVDTTNGVFSSAVTEDSTLSYAVAGVGVSLAVPADEPEPAG